MNTSNNSCYWKNCRQMKPEGRSPDCPGFMTGFPLGCRRCGKQMIKKNLNFC